MERNLTPGEKVDTIYTILTQWEARRKRAAWYRVFKWIIILMVVYLIATRPDMIMWRITETLKPLILSTASGMISTQKAELSKALKDLLPSGVEIQ